MLKKGYVQIYTGNGKGKTTAAIGLAVRAVGAGLKVFFGQFIKSGCYSEIKPLKKFGKNISVRQFGRGCFIHSKPGKKDMVLAQKGFEEISTAVQSGKYDVIILDEAVVAVRRDLIFIEGLLSLIKNKPDRVELVITGRGADRKLLKAADLVTEMREIKHYFKKGVTARKGIEK